MRAALFDLDGTLLDTLGGIADSANAALVLHGRQPVAFNQVVAAVGDGADALIERLLAVSGGSDAALVAAVLASYRDHYRREEIPRTRAFSGLRELLIGLASRRAVVSNKPEQYVRATLDAAGLLELFDSVAGYDTFSQPKPSPVPVLCTLERLGVAPAAAIFVGDGLQDVAAARAAGVVCIGVTWGVSTADALLAAGADHVVAHVDQLDALLAGWARR